MVIDIIRHALNPSLQPPKYPFDWNPPATWSALQIVTAIAVTIMVLATVRAVLTYIYNMITARLTQGEIVPTLRAQLYAKLQRLSFSFFDVHGSNSIFNRVTGDVQNTRLFVDGVLLQGVNMILTLAAYAFFMWRIQPALTLACLSVSLPLWWLAQFYSARLRPGYLKNRELTDNMILLFSESVRGMQTVKGFAAESHQVRKFEAANDEVSSQQRKIFWNLSIFTPGTQMLSQLSLVILFAYGGCCMCREKSRSAADWWCSPACSSNSPDKWRTFRRLPIPCNKVLPPRGAFLKCSTRRSKCKVGQTP
ncbi:MAG: ABC transporter ATP-binding protein [Limisphaerales bacterium]